MPATATTVKRGVKKGVYNSGQFKKGNDPRRFDTSSPRPKWKDDLAEALAASVPDAVAFLAEAVADTDRPDSIRMLAAQEILDRRFGKAISREAHLIGVQPSPAQIPKSIDDYSEQELDALAAQTMKLIEQEKGGDPELLTVDNADIVDGEVVGEGG
jgi:hypothetical protein